MGLALRLTFERPCILKLHCPNYEQSFARYIETRKQRRSADLFYIRRVGPVTRSRQNLTGSVARRPWRSKSRFWH